MSSAHLQSDSDSFIFKRRKNKKDLKKDMGNEDNDQAGSRRKSPRKKDTKIEESPTFSTSQEIAGKPIFKLYLKSNDSLEALNNISSQGLDKLREPTMLRLRIGSAGNDEKSSSESVSNSIQSNVDMKKTRKRKTKEDSKSDSSPVTLKKRKGQNKVASDAEPKVIRRRRKKTEDLSKNSQTITQNVENVKFDDDDEVKSQVVQSMTEIVNEDFCHACGSTGYFICCETCPKSFHLDCIFPPIKEVPNDNWMCIECRVKYGACKDHELREASQVKINPGENYQALWSSIRSGIILSDPVAFTLQKRLRNKKDATVGSFFEGVQVEEPKKRRRGSGPVESKAPPAFNNKKQALRQPNQITGVPAVNGRISLSGHCHHCGQRSIVPDMLPFRAEPLTPNPLIKCDKCPLMWHPDCIDPPLTVIPTAESKWICPAHVNLPIHPNYIVDVDFEDQHNPFEYEIAARLLPPIPPRKIVLPERKILLDFGSKLRQLRPPKAIPPSAIQEAYESLQRIQASHYS